MSFKRIREIFKSRPIQIGLFIIALLIEAVLTLCIVSWILLNMQEVSQRTSLERYEISDLTAKSFARAIDSLALTDSTYVRFKYHYDKGEYTDLTTTEVWHKMVFEDADLSKGLFHQNNVMYSSHLRDSCQSRHGSLEKPDNEKKGNTHEVCIDSYFVYFFYINLESQKCMVRLEILHPDKKPLCVSLEEMNWSYELLENQPKRYGRPVFKSLAQYNAVCRALEEEVLNKICEYKRDWLYSLRWFIADFMLISCWLIIPIYVLLLKYIIKVFNRLAQKNMKE